LYEKLYVELYQEFLRFRQVLKVQLLSFYSTKNTTLNM